MRKDRFLMNMKWAADILHDVRDFMSGIEHVDVPEIFKDRAFRHAESIDAAGAFLDSLIGFLEGETEKKRGSKFREAQKIAEGFFNDESKDFEEIENTGICTECLAQRLIEPEADDGLCYECGKSKVWSVLRLTEMI